MTDKLVTIRSKKLEDRIDRKKLIQIRSEQLPARTENEAGAVLIFQHADTGKIYVERVADRNRVRNTLDQYEEIDDTSQKMLLKPLTLEVANRIVDRVIEGTTSFNSCFVFGKLNYQELNWTKTEAEHKFTSTGIKFWRHQQQMEAFRLPHSGAARNTIISTHISPEGKCNLRCPYCSVTYRDTHSRIELSRIQQYIRDLKTRGLKAVILTGGGEPTLYPHFNELVQWIKHDQKLSVALITNGTTSDKIEDSTYACFSWIRISINIFPGWEEKINLRTAALNSDCIVGCSMVFTVEHEALDKTQDDRQEIFKVASKIADRVGAKYIRLLPNCLLEQDRLVAEHAHLQKMLSELGDSRFFQQYKVHGAPSANVCHQAYFRPYLSEEPSKIDGIPGSVYPCDSVVLNDSATHFAKQYQLCKPENILDFVDGNIKQEFHPQRDCKGCVFTSNVNMLDRWLNDGEGSERFEEHQDGLMHEEFV